MHGRALQYIVKSADLRLFVLVLLYDNVSGEWGGFDIFVLVLVFASAARTQRLTRQREDREVLCAICELHSQQEFDACMFVTVKREVEVP